MKHDRDNIRDNILCTCFGQKLFLDTGHFFAQLVSILTTKKEGKKRREKGGRKNRMKQETNGRMAAGWLRGRGRQEKRADMGGGGGWESESRMVPESMAEEESGVDSRCINYYLHPQWSETLAEANHSPSTFCLSHHLTFPPHQAQTQF